MTNARSPVFLLLAALVTCACATVYSQEKLSKPKGSAALKLDLKNNGQHVNAKVGQKIEITVGTVGPGNYGAARVSTPAVQFEKMEYAALQIPAGQTQIYYFRALKPGTAEIFIPHERPADVKRWPFRVTISVTEGR